MGRGITTGKLTKDFILSKVSQITIFSVYFNIPVKIINNCINTGELICSPIRIDSHPTCGFRYDNKGKLKFKDFAGYFWGDCFDAVALILSSIENKPVIVSNRKDFFKILTHITLTFKDIFYGTEKDINLINNINNSIEIIRNKKPIIELVIRDWNEDDKAYWYKFNIDFQTLNTNFIYPIEQYYIDRKINPTPKYFYDKSDPCYAYLLGKDRNGIYSIKLYFPYRDHNQTRFITNCNHLEGIYNLDREDYDIIVITKSTKDRICLTANLRKFISLYGGLNIGVINIPHETYRLRDREFKWLRNKLNPNGQLISLMDNDRTGKYEASWLRREFNILPIIIPKDYNSKDFAELVVNNNINTVKELILTTINKIKYDVSKTNAIVQDKETSSFEPF